MTRLVLLWLALLACLAGCIYLAWQAQVSEAILVGLLAAFVAAACDDEWSRIASKRYLDRVLRRSKGP